MIVIATRNQHKVQEIQAILGKEIEVAGLEQFPEAPEVVEDAGTFQGNAMKKAVELATWLSRLPAGRVRGITAVLADDSGLEVDELQGAPGVHSARFAALDGPGAADKLVNSDPHANNLKLLRLMREAPPERRAARFRCVLAFVPLEMENAEAAAPVCSANPWEFAAELFDGTCEGRLAFEPRGTGGFGYDPLFMPNGFQETFGELPEAVKNKLSHRSQALGKLRERYGKR